MFRDDYKALFDAVSPAPTLERQTEREIIEMLQPRQRRNMRRTICIAAIVIVLTLGAAFAAISASGIIDRLFRFSEPSERALQSVVRNAVCVSDSGLTLNMDEYLFDHNTVHLGWTVRSEREKPVYYTTGYDIAYSNAEDADIAEESAGGLYGAGSSTEVGDSILVRLGENRSSYSGYASYKYIAPLNSTINARVFIRAYETDCEELELPIDFIWDLVEDEELNAALEEKGQIGLTENGQTNVQGYAAFREALQKLSEAGMDWDAANERALVESGLFREVAALELTVPIQPELAPEIRFTLEEETRYELSDASVILRQFDIDAASTILEYEVITDKLFEEDGGIGNGISYLLFDQTGHPLNADCMLSMSMGQLNDREGRHVYLVSAFGNPIPEDVTAITFVPTAQLQFGEESAYEYYLRMRDEALPEQCFTVEIG